MFCGQIKSSIATRKSSSMGRKSCRIAQIRPIFVCFRPKSGKISRFWLVFGQFRPHFGVFKSFSRKFVKIPCKNIPPKTRYCCCFWPPNHANSIVMLATALRACSHGKCHSMSGYGLWAAARPWGHNNGDMWIFH